MLDFLSSLGWQFWWLVMIPYVSWIYRMDLFLQYECGAFGILHLDGLHAILEPTVKFCHKRLVPVHRQAQHEIGWVFHPPFSVSFQLDLGYEALQEQNVSVIVFLDGHWVHM